LHILRTTVVIQIRIYAPETVAFQLFLLEGLRSLLEGVKYQHAIRQLPWFLLWQDLLVKFQH
jgi:hypothetical protein